jgi:hypothetical protein
VDRVDFHPSIAANQVELDSIKYTIAEGVIQYAVLVDQDVAKNAGVSHLTSVKTLEFTLSEKSKPKRGKGK